ncbi:uncharacterized protein V6R79_022306 [Siganus canaliculatus]
MPGFDAQLWNKLRWNTDSLPASLPDGTRASAALHRPQKADKPPPRPAPDPPQTQTLCSTANGPATIRKSGVLEAYMTTCSGWTSAAVRGSLSV